MRALLLSTGLLLLVACDPDKDADGSTGETGSSVDADGDGFGGDSDCDDASSAVHPGAEERCDGIDNNCDGLVDNDPTDGQTYFLDEDGDGHGGADAVRACTPGEGMAAESDDCDDADAQVHPGGTEVCGGGDEDCDGLTDDEDDSVDPASLGAWFVDADDDGHGDPLQPSTAACADPSDDTRTYSATAGDCDDTRTDIHPDATERCDALDEDEDCDGLADNADDSTDLGDAPLWHPDADGDGFGDGAHGGRPACDDPSEDGDPWLLDATDCDDADPAISPAATERCDALDVDEDCDGRSDDDDETVDLGTTTAWFPDADGDGHGDAAAEAMARCNDPSDGVSTYLEDRSDCDDTDPAVSPSATEICDENDVDEDCSGAADDEDAGVDPATHTTWYTDDDGDGHGDLTDSGGGWCDDPSSASQPYSLVSDDCDDSSAGVNPSATEVCDADDVDEDCSGDADDDDAGLDTSSWLSWAPDTDGDGHGDASATPLLQCNDPSGSGTAYVDNLDDCDDTDAAISPDATEVCDDGSVDEDCDGAIDDDDASLDTSTAAEWFEDGDLDGYGDAAATAVLACADPSDATTTYAEVDTDCDDGDADVNPGATEIYGDGIDQTCAASDVPTFACPGGAYTVPGSYSTLAAAASALGNSGTVQTICLTGSTTENPTLTGNLEVIGTSSQDVTINGHMTVRSGVSGATIDVKGVTITNGVEVIDDSSILFDFTITDSVIKVSNNYGVHVDRDGTGTPNVTIERCTVHGKSPDAAIYFYDYSYNSTDRVYWTVKDSWITGGTYGIRTAVTSSSTRSPDQTFTFVGNTIEDASYGIYAAGRGGSSTTFRILNNIIANNSRGLSFNGKGSMTNDYNLYWNNSSANFYLSATGGSHRVTTDPGLSSDTPPVPSATGGAAGAGTTSYASTTDYWTNSRASPPSIGAVEPF